MATAGFLPELVSNAPQKKDFKIHIGVDFGTDGVGMSFLKS